MTLDAHTCYRALRARDARFDGRFFVAVSSTRIYCRPVCTVKPPQARELPLLSERGGRRVGRLPALPALPARSSRPATRASTRPRALAQAAASLIEDRTLDDEGLEAVAARLGITDRHLRRAFGAEFGVSPVEFAQTQRLLLAKRLLTDTRAAGHRGGVRERLRQPAALQRALQAALPAAAEPAAPAHEGQRRGGRRTRCTSN